MGIVVVTHNGELPKNGGKRLGYRVSGYWIPVGTGWLISPEALKPKKETESVSVEATGLIIFSALRRVAWSDGECSYCDHSPNSTIIIDTDMGRRRVVKCSRCSMVMRPYV